jgi:hypothetical protein
MFCWNEDGSILAKVPMHADSGDILCVLWCSNIPHVLRAVSEKEGHCQLIGSAYIDGYMYRETVTAMEAGLMTEESFVLE